MRQKKIISVVFILTLLCGTFYQPYGAYADTALTVYITEGTLNHALNRTMKVGEMRSGWKIELNKKRTVKSATWRSTDTSVITIEGNSSNATVTAHKEGTAKLILTVVTNRDEIVSNDCIISVITPLEGTDQVAGYVKSSADFFRGASVESEVRNMGEKGQILTVIALCGEFLRVRLPKDYDFQDTLNQDTAYAKKVDIAIPVEKVSIKDKKSERIVKCGDIVDLNVEYSPEMATEKNFIWKSSNPQIASVSSDGKITANKTGEATITVSEKNSGKLDTCKFIVTRDTIVAQRASKPKLYIKKESDFRGNYVRWYGISNAKSYKLYIGLWNKKKKKVVYKTKKVSKKNYYDTNIIKGKNYHYYVRAYDAEGKLLAISKKVKIKATAPELTAQPVSVDQIQLDWKEKKSKNLKDIKGYRIYRSSKEKGTYKCIKNIKKKSTFTWTDNKRKSGTEYFYRICAYQKKKGKLKNGAKSFVVSAKTYKTISEMTNWNYFYSMKNTWSGVFMQRGTVSEEQSRRVMNQSSVKVDGNTEHPYLKYHLTTETLYIHIYVDYCTYIEENGKLVRKPIQDKQFEYDGEAQGGTYKEEFENGLKSGYAIKIEGTSEDFAPDVNFKTKLVLHEKGKENYHKDQCFLTVKIGGECKGVFDYLEKCPSNHWFHAYVMTPGSIIDDTYYIYIPTNDQLKEPETLQGFRNAAMHEMGHILGLNDAYVVTDEQGNVVKRLLYNTETCAIIDGYYLDNIMNSCRENICMTENDIEMMLYAYGCGIKQTESVCQSYKDYVLNGESYSISKVIVDREEEDNDEIN